MKENLLLFIYAMLKAFLPLPSLEVVLLPLVMKHPQALVLYSLIGAAGTYFGGSIGYFLAQSMKEDVWVSLFGESTWKKGKQFMNRYGIMAVVIGGITPIPDFILAYLAGFLRMNYLAFACSDGLARLIRSLIVLYLFQMLGVVVDMDRYGMYILYAMVGYLLIKYVLKMIKRKLK